MVVRGQRHAPADVDVEKRIVLSLPRMETIFFGRPSRSVVTVAVTSWAHHKVWSWRAVGHCGGVVPKFLIPPAPRSGQPTACPATMPDH